MLTVRLATAPDPKPMPGLLRVEIDGFGAPFAVPMPAPGLAISLGSIQPPKTAPSGFTIKIRYFLDDRKVGVVVNGVGGNDSIAIFASRLDVPELPIPGVLYVGNILHSGFATTNHDCSVHCENSDPIIEECCVVCRSENIVTETCC